jgi:hypothetical protein
MSLGWLFCLCVTIFGHVALMTGYPTWWIIKKCLEWTKLSLMCQGTIEITLCHSSLKTWTKSKWGNGKDWAKPLELQELLWLLLQLSTPMARWPPPTPLLYSSLLNKSQSTTSWNHQNHKQNFEIAKHNEELRFRARIWNNIRQIWEWWRGRIWKRRGGWRQFKRRALQLVWVEIVIVLLRFWQMMKLLLCSAFWICCCVAEKLLILKINNFRN